LHRCPDDDEPVSGHLDCERIPFGRGGRRAKRLSSCHLIVQGDYEMAAGRCQESNGSPYKVG